MGSPARAVDLDCPHGRPDLAVADRGGCRLFRRRGELSVPAPFSRRQLLIYKIEGFVTGSLLMAMVLPGALRSNGIGVWYPAAFLGCALALLFMQLGQLAVVLLAGSMGTQKFTRRRKIVLGVGAALLLVAVIQTGKAARDDGLMPFLARLSETVVGEVLLFPFRSLVELILAQQLWPDVAAWLAAALAVNGAVLWLALVLDVIIWKSWRLRPAKRTMPVSSRCGRAWPPALCRAQPVGPCLPCPAGAASAPCCGGN